MATTKKASSSKLLELYIKELVKNTVKEEIARILPTLTESVVRSLGVEATPLTEGTTAINKKPAPDRATIRSIMQQNFALDGDTIAPRANPAPMTFNASITGGHDVEVPDFMQKILTRDYTELVKKL